MRATLTLPDGKTVEAPAELHDLGTPGGLENWRITMSRIDWADFGAIQSSRQGTIQLDDGSTVDVLVLEVGGTSGEARSAWVRFQVNGTLNPAT